MAATILIVVALLVIFLVAWLFQSKSKEIRAKIDKIPGPKPLPLVGNALQLTGTGPEFFQKIWNIWQTFGDKGILRLWLGPKPVVGILRADYAERILHSSKLISKSELYRFLHPWLGTGLLTSTGEKWFARRRMLTPTFHFRILNDFVGVFNDQAKVLVGKLSEVGDNKNFNIFPYITLCALDIICETAMGKHVNAQGNSDSDYVLSIYAMSELVNKRQRSPWFWPNVLFYSLGDGRKHDRCIRILQDFTRKVIHEKFDEFRKTRQESTTMEEMLMEDSEGRKGRRLAFLDMLLCAAEDGSKLSKENIQEEVDTFMFEGHDTTAAAMNWAMHLIGSHPDVQATIHEEIDGIFGDSDRAATMEDLKNMRYLECAIKETLRLYPSVPMFGRRLTEDVNIGGYDIPKDTEAIIVPMAIHQDPTYFPDPRVFKPERFLPENSIKRHPYAFIPFSAGPRNCIGQKFALLEEKVVLSTILRKFSVKATQTDDDLRPVAELILRPEEGIFVELKTRT